MKFEDITKNINEKLGEENIAKIADDMASLLSYDSAMKKDIKDKDKEIIKLRKDKEMLIEANGSLLQQVKAENEEILKPTVNEDKKENKPFNFYNMYDEKGNFKKTLS